MEDIKKVFGRNVRKYREQMEWSQAELAERIDISTAFMTHIEHGTRGVSMETIECLAVTFGIPYTALFDEKSTNNVRSERIKINGLKKRLLSSVSEIVDNFLEN